MKTTVVYPVPMDNVEVFKTFLPYIHRFTNTLRSFDPGVMYDLVAVCCNADPTDTIKFCFRDLPVTFLRYDGAGADLGSQQFVANQMPGCFQVNMTSRCYFHREDWLLQYVTARNVLGPALYGASASWQCGRLHLCTRGHAYDTDDFVKYPHLINSRELGPMFEVFDGCVLRWFEENDRSAYVVHWGKALPKDKWFTEPNRFRNGDQSAMLIWDKHSDIYRDADPEEKERLARESEPASQI